MTETDMRTKVEFVKPGDMFQYMRWATTGTRPAIEVLVTVISVSRWDGPDHTHTVTFLVEGEGLVTRDWWALSEIHLVNR